MTKADLTVVVLAFVLFAGCDRLGLDKLKPGQADSAYRAAMADYSAGNLDKAIAGLEKVVKASPANVAARFQLACLLQDHRHDYLAAVCQYREFLALGGDTAKRQIVSERLAACRRLLVADIVKNADASTHAAVYRENDELKTKVAAGNDEIARLKRELARYEDELAAARRECARARKLVAGLGDGEATEKPRQLAVTERDLLDDDGADGVDRVAMSKDIANLIAEEKEETTETPFAKTEKKPAATPAPEPAKESRPKSYVVKNGDTLYDLARRFYGKSSAWKTIRDANRTKVSTDGRITVGQELVLP